MKDRLDDLKVAEIARRGINPVYKASLTDDLSYTE